jgi:ferredoxin-nitrite reductase
VQIKLEKDPMKWLAEGGIEELAQKSMEEIDSSKEWKDDVDTRLKWAGLFHRRKHQCKNSSSWAFLLIISSCSATV